MNATFQPEKIGNPNGLQITYLKDYSTRNMFVYHDSGKVCVVTCIIRRIKRWSYMFVSLWASLQTFFKTICSYFPPAEGIQ